MGYEREYRRRSGLKSVSLFAAGALTVLLIGLGAASCRKNNTPSDKAKNKIPNNNNEVVAEENTNVDMTNNSSIEDIVDKSYTDYIEFYTETGISKDQVRDMVFVLNDVYTDEDGKLLIDEDRVHEAYSNMKDVMYSDQMINMIGMIDAKESGIEIDDNYKISDHPSLAEFVDTNKVGGEETFKKLSDYEEVRNKEIELMNNEGRYDKDIIITYIINNSVNNINGNTDDMDNITKNGQKFVVAATKFYGLQMAASTNSQTEYIKVNEDGVSDIKINPTEEERKLIADYYQYLDEGIDIPEEITSRYIEYLNKKLDTGYFRVMCDEEAETVMDVNNIMNSLGNQNTYTYRSNEED